MTEPPAPSEPVGPGTAAGSDGDDVSLILAEARARAHELIDESVAQAEALLHQREGATPGGAEMQQTLDRVRRMVADMAGEVRALHGRLDSLEALMRSRQPAVAPPSTPAPAPRPAAPPPAAEAAPVTPAPAPPPRPVAPPPIAQAEPLAPERTSPPAGPPPAPPMRESPPAAERAERPSVSPPREPMRPAPPPPPPPSPVAEAPDDEESVEETTPVPAAEAADTEVTPNGGSTEEDVVLVESFSPDGGSVLLRVSPVSGFQGLMRVQDTLVRLRAIREASVEAYSQGEARLRIQLAEPLDPSVLAVALGDGLGQSARVESASLPERSLQVALG